MSVSVSRAVEFIRSAGSARDREAVRILFESGHARGEVVQTVLAGQRADGGWPPAEGFDVSSVSETVWRLTQLDELGVDRNHPSVREALTFLKVSQQACGAWKEHESLREVLPPWAAPGRPAATIYVTASAGYTVLVFCGPEEATARRAADYLAAQTGPHGSMPSFIHSHWLAAALWWGLGRREMSDRTMAYLSTRIGPHTPDNQLSWMAVALMSVGVSPENALLSRVLHMILERQAPDGRFTSEDGPECDPHATYEALRALKMAGML